MLLNDLGDDGQAQAGSPLLGGEERIEYPLQVLGRDAHSFIDNAYFHEAVRLMLDVNLQLAATGQSLMSC